MPIRLIAVDLDGTLLNSKAEISAADRDALHSAAAAGVEVAIVTGRRFHSARPIVAQLDCPLTLISSNGARIGSLDGATLYRNFLPARVAQDALCLTRGFRRFTVLIHDQPGRGQVVMQEGGSLDGPLGWYRRSSPEALLEVPDLESALPPEASTLIQVMFGGPPEEIEPIEPLLLGSAIAPQAHLTWTKYPARNTFLLDVMNCGCTKGATLQMWAAQRGISAAEVMALGDNHNDHEMLAFAGRPVVMGNAEPGVCRQGWATTLSNDADGVAAAIRRYVLEA